MALLHPDFPKSVVAIGTKQDGRFVADSTGFAVNMEVRESDKKILLPKDFEGVMPERFVGKRTGMFLTVGMR